MEILTQEIIEEYITPKIDFNSTSNKIVSNLQESPFLNENVIMDLVKDGQISKERIYYYFKIKDKYRQYINIRIIVYDKPDAYNSLKKELNSLINGELVKEKTSN